MEELKNDSRLDNTEEAGQIFRDEDIPWVLFTVAGVVYGIHSSYILSIEILGAVTPVINSAPHTRGMTNFRGSMINLTELRLLFGKPNRIMEYYELIAPKVEEHSYWMDALREYVNGQAPFTLETDPRDCAFGRWYHSYKPDNNTVSAYLSQLETLHVKLHEAAREIISHVEKEERDEAARLLSEVAEPVYAEIVKMLGEAIDTFNDGTNEMLIVLDLKSAGGCAKGIIVDEIVAVEYISDTISVQDHFGKMSQIKRLGKRGKDGSPILLIDEEFIEEL